MLTTLQSDVASEHLETHAALASRLISSKPVLQIYFRWLNRPTLKSTPPQVPTPAVKSSLDSLLNPLRNDCDRTTQRETENASLWLGGICEYVAARNRACNSGFYLRALAASFLPLYRTLATGRLNEGLTQTLHRVSEVLLLINLSETLQLERFLEMNVGPHSSPGKAIAEQLKIDLSKLSFLFGQVLDGYNQAKDQFDNSSVSRLAAFRAGEKLPTSHQIPEWSNPQLLWVLSNELVSSRSELVLPRSWIDTPVPWSKLSEHWSGLEHLLTAPCKEGGDSKPNEAKATVSSPAQELDAKARDRNEEPAKPNNINMQAVKLPERSTIAALDKAAAIVEAAEMGWDNLETMDVIDQVLEQEFSKKSSPVEPAAPKAANATPVAKAPKREPMVIPKVMIGEITNHNDPAFVNVVRRQVGTCKQEDRSVCLSMILVTAQDQRENQTLSAPQDNGLNHWQQKLVNWICDHPELKQPLAFLTRDGQLILVVMDTERNAMTRLLRQGLVEVLTGKRDQSDDLARVAIPAHFHVGISSTSSPSASFESDELIASAHRCQSAAQRMGSASIKSIEVY